MDVEKVIDVVSPTDAVQKLMQLQQDLDTLVRNVLPLHDRIYTNRTRETYALIRESLETGAHGLAATGLTALIATCHDLRNEWDTAILERILPVLEAVRSATEQLCSRFELPIPLVGGPRVQGMDLDTLSVPTGHKRRRVDPDPSDGEPGSTQRAVLAVLRDPSRSFGGCLSADEHRLLSTVITESALLPDVAAMHDCYHPNTCLYATEGDREWTGSTGVHLGFYVNTMLHEFAVHRGCMRRFTFNHILMRMGFGAPDANFYATYLDDTFYRRIFCDTRISFLAEGYSPKIRLYRGQGWAQLWDLFLSGNRGDVPWRRLTRAGVAAEELLRELDGADVQRLIPHTLLGALHRRFGASLQPYDAWPVMEGLCAMESEFLQDVRELAHGRLAPVVDALPTMVRAWPMCLRQVAVEHVRSQMRSLVILPRCMQVAGDVPDVAAWLWSIADRHDDGPVWGARAPLRCSERRTDRTP